MRTRPPFSRSPSRAARPIRKGPILRSGARAYVDSFFGLIPCKVLAIRGDSGISSSSQDVDVLLTANRGAYKRGERLTWRGLNVVPREAVRFRKHGVRIRQYFVRVDRH